MGKGRHRQFMGPVDEFPDQGLDDLRRQVQAFFQVEGGHVFVTQMVAPVVALPGQVQEGGHDVGHHPVDVEGQLVFGKRAYLIVHFDADHRKGFTMIAVTRLG